MPVIPIVLYHGKESWNPGNLSTQFKKLPDAAKPFIPDFEYVFIDLSSYSDEAIKQQVFTLASLKKGVEITRHLVMKSAG